MLLAARIDCLRARALRFLLEMERARLHYGRSDGVFFCTNRHCQSAQRSYERNRREIVLQIFFATCNRLMRRRPDAQKNWRAQNAAIRDDCAPNSATIGGIVTRSLSSRREM